MISGLQIRMARAALGWTVAELSEKSGVSASSIARAEAIDGIATMRASSLFELQQALEANGVVFLAAGQDLAGGDGVRMRE